MKWEDLDKRESHFTIRNAITKDLRTGKVVQYYSANTKITLVQKCNYNGTTYYRTESAMRNDLDWAFEASAFGLPNEIAPLEPSSAVSMPVILKPKPAHSTRKKPAKRKQKVVQTVEPTHSGGVARKKSFWSRIFKRK